MFHQHHGRDSDRLTLLDQERISKILGSTMEPVDGDPVQQYLKHKAEAEKKANKDDKDQNTESEPTK